MSRNKARVLRRKATDAERLLWRHLRQLKRVGFHFRRQAPIGPYFADFACHSVKLIVELDGAQHGDAQHLEHDAKRDAYLESCGYIILRIWNGQVFTDSGSVADYVFCKAKERFVTVSQPPTREFADANSRFPACASAPLPHDWPPTPQGGGGKLNTIR